MACIEARWGATDFPLIPRSENLDQDTLDRISRRSPSASYQWRVPSSPSTLPSSFPDTLRSPLMHGTVPRYLSIDTSLRASSQFSRRPSEKPTNFVFMLLQSLFVSPCQRSRSPSRIFPSKLPVVMRNNKGSLPIAALTCRPGKWQQ